MPKPARIDHYNVLELQQSASNCEIYLCEDPTTRARDSVLVIAVRNDADDIIARIRREGPMLAELGVIPEIAAPVHFVRQPPGFVVRALPSLTLERVLREHVGFLPMDDVHRYMAGVLRAIEGAHQRGIVHRSLSASLVFVDTPQAAVPVRVTGFGLATVLESEKTWSQTGTMVGDIDYLAPEHFLSQPIDARADVYAMGILLYELCTGQKPFSGSSVFQVMQGHCSQSLPDPLRVRPDLDPRVVDVIRCATAKRPYERYAHGEAMRQAFEEATSGLTRAQPVFADTLMAPHATSFSQARGGASPFLGASPSAAEAVGPSGEAPNSAERPRFPAADRVSLPSDARPNMQPRDVRHAGQWSLRDVKPVVRSTPPVSRASSTPWLAGLLGGLLLASAIGGGLWYANKDVGKLRPRQEVGGPAPSTRPSSAATTVFDGACDWALTPSAASPSAVLLHDEAGVLPDVIVTHKRHHAQVEGLTIPDRFGDRLEWSTGRILRVAVWIDPATDRAWTFLLLAKSSDQPPRLVVLQSVERQLLTAHTIPVSRKDVTSVDVALVAGATQCAFVISVQGDSGGGPEAKSMTLRPDPEGITVIEGALGYLWVEEALFEGLPRTNFHQR